MKTLQNGATTLQLLIYFLNFAELAVPIRHSLLKQKSNDDDLMAGIFFM